MLTSSHHCTCLQDKEGAAARAALLEAAVEAPEEEDPEFIMVTGGQLLLSCIFCSCRSSQALPLHGLLFASC